MFECCRRSALYNLRRYDPTGRTLWVRDWFHGFTGGDLDEPFAACRMIVDGDRIIVTGPIAWIDESRPETHWNAACYTVAGNLLWRRRIGPASAGLTDVAHINDTYYAVRNGEEVGDFILHSFNDQGDTTGTWGPGGIGPTLVTGDAATIYPNGGNEIPAGLLSLGYPDAQAVAAVYLPAVEEFVIGLPNFGPGGDIVLVQRAETSSLITPGGPYTWSLNDSLSSPPNWIPPHTLARAPGGFVSANDFGTYIDAEGDTLGSGTLVHLDTTGAPDWFRGTHDMLYVESDDSGRLYSSTFVRSADYPSVMRWSMEGDFIWGHSHNRCHQIRIIDDRGIVTVGTRVEYGNGERNWLAEGSFE